MSEPAYIWRPIAHVLDGDTLEERESLRQPLVVFERSSSGGVLEVLHRVQSCSVHEAVVDQGWWIDWPPDASPYPDPVKQGLRRPVTLPPDPYADQRSLIYREAVLT